MKNRTLFPISRPFAARITLGALPLMMGLLLLQLGCGGDDPTGPPLVLQPSDLCSQQPDDAIATFEDATLEAAIRAELSVGATCGLVSGLTALAAEQAGITSLVGIQNLTSLDGLDLSFNSITDISALSGLPSLTFLFLSDNSITDISPLSGLMSLTTLDLGNNPNLTDIQPLLDNTGLGAGDTVVLTNTNVSCADVAALEAKGVRVISDCP